MRILVVTPMPASPALPGAMPKLFRALLLGLAETHDVTAVTVAGPGEAELAAARGVRISGVDVHIVTRSNNGLTQVWRRRLRVAWGLTVLRLPWRAAWCYGADAQGTIDRLGRDRRFDLIAVEDDAMAVYRYPRGVPVVLTEHEVRRRRRARWPRPGRRWVRRLLGELDWRRWPRYQARAWERFDVVQAFTDRDARLIAERSPALGDRTRIVPFGIEVPRPADPRRQVAGRMVFAGSLTHAPNVDAALWLVRDILPSIRKRRMEAHLVLVGPGPPPEVVALAGPAVEVSGEVANPHDEIERAEIVVAPIRIGGGMRMKVLEAMALGKAVVTTQRGAEGLAVGGDEPPLVIADSTDDFAAAVDDLLGDDDSRRELGRRARAFVQRHHGHDSYARRLETVYREAAGP